MRTKLHFPSKALKFLFLLDVRRFVARYRRASSYYSKTRRLIMIWSASKTEFSNYYYELTQRNQLHLISFLSFITNEASDVIVQYLNEILEDSELKNHISEFWKNDKLMSDASVAFGRRIGWYALIRSQKPKFVVETGVHHGIGACVIARALQLNTTDGFPGKYLGTDINPKAGEIFSRNKNFDSIGRIEIGDSIETLKRLKNPIDFFINDSDHNPEYEYREYQAIKNLLSKNSLILSDNSHASDALLNFSKENSRKFLFFREEPKNHWYPGSGIGVSFL